MPENLLGKRLTERHQNDGPVNCVKPHDILADYVQVGGPQFIVKLRLVVGVIADCRDIIGKCVDPDINNVFGVKFDGNAPCERGTRNAEILKPRLDEVVYHLVAA